MVDIQADVKIDRFPVARLAARYNISRTVLYQRIESLQISRERKGNKAFINGEQLKMLDELHDYLASGGATSDFIDRMGLSTSTDKTLSTGQLTLLSNSPEDKLLGLVDAIAEKLAPTDILASFRTLDEAVAKKWLITTSQIAWLLELAPSTVVKHKIFSRRGFKFTKLKRDGLECVWRVEKDVL